MDSSAASPKRRTSTRRYQKGEITREQILRAGRKLFTERGYKNTSIFDILENAGITKGAFYHHWKTKEDLALTIFNEVKEAYASNLFNILNSEVGGREAIRRAITILGELNAQESWYCCRLQALWSSELNTQDELLGAEVHQFRNRWRHFWIELFTRAQNQEDIRGDISAENLSMLVISTLDGVQHNGTPSNRAQMLGLFDTLRLVIFT